MIWLTLPPQSHHTLNPQYKSTRTLHWPFQMGFAFVILGIRLLGERGKLKTKQTFIRFYNKQIKTSSKKGLGIKVFSLTN